MRPTFSLSILSILGLAGCQGLGGYSAQSVTRVPPIGTSSYQVPGNYYGNTAPAPPPGGVPLSGTGGNLMPASGQLPSTASYNTSNFNQSNIAGSVDATTAQYEMPTSPVGSGMGSAVSTASAVNPTSAANGEVGQLQWRQ